MWRSAFEGMFAAIRLIFSKQEVLLKVVSKCGNPFINVSYHGIKLAIQQGVGRINWDQNMLPDMD